jgi:hypothetical protein
VNCDARKLFKLYEQAVSVGGMPLQQPGAYDIQVPTATASRPSSLPGEYGTLDYKDAKENWRAFQKENFVLALFIQILDPSSITSIPDIDDAYHGWLEEKNTLLKVRNFAWFLFNIFAAIPLWVPFGGQIGKILNLAKGGKVAGKVAANPKVVVGALDTIFKAIKTPSTKKFIIGVMERLKANPKAIEDVMKAIESSDPAQLIKLTAEQLGIKGDDFSKALKEFTEEEKAATKLISTDAGKQMLKKVELMSKDGLLMDAANQGLVAKIKYWLGTIGKGSTEQDAIAYLKNGNYSDLPENIRGPVLNELLKKYNIKESQLADYVKMIWPEAKELAATTASKIGAKIASETPEIASKVTAIGAREIDKIAKELEGPIEMLNKKDLPRGIQSMVDKIKTRGGAELASALEKINARNLPGYAAKSVKAGELVLTRGEKQALEKAAKALEEGGLLRGLVDTAGRLAVKGAKVMAFNAFIGVKAVAALQYWLRKQYEKGKAYQPAAQKQIKVTGLPGGYTPQGATASTPQGRNAPNARQLYPPTNTANQYQYKPVKWWSTQ